jgi:hypothetical protein
MVISTKKKNGSRTKTKTKFGNRKKSLKSRKNRLRGNVKSLNNGFELKGSGKKYNLPNRPKHKPDRAKMPLPPPSIQKHPNHGKHIPYEVNKSNKFINIGRKFGILPAHEQPLQQPLIKNIQLSNIQQKMNNMSQKFNEAQSKKGIRPQNSLTTNRSKMTPTQLRIQDIINKNKEIEAENLSRARLQTIQNPYSKSSSSSTYAEITNKNIPLINTTKPPPLPPSRKIEETQTTIKPSYLNISTKSRYEVPVSKIESTYGSVNTGTKTNAEKFANMLKVSATPTSRKESPYGVTKKKPIESEYARLSEIERIQYPSEPIYQRLSFEGQREKPAFEPAYASLSKYGRIQY